MQPARAEVVHHLIFPASAATQACADVLMSIPVAALRAGIAEVRRLR